MGVKLNLTDEQKKMMANLNIEFKVLSQLATERRAIMDSTARDILTTNGYSPKLYALSFSPAKDSWEAILKPNALTVPAPGADIKKIVKN